jgi:hypothetical protein
MMAAKKKTSSIKRKTVKKTPRKQTKAQAKPKVKEMIQTHGMQEKESYEKTTLDQVWGDIGSNKYGTLDTEDYSDRLTSMNRSDLHAHAVTVGILPIDNRELLVSRLKREFRKHVLGYRKPRKSRKSGSGVSDKVKSILSEGK